MILIYTHSITPRVEYTFNLIFTEMLKTEWALTDNDGRARSFDGAVIDYTPTPVKGTLQFLPHGLLNETGTRVQQIEMKTWQGMPVFFGVDGSSSWPFDPFAMIFYMVSRYEEYMKFAPDQHGRFPSRTSLAGKNGFLHLPLVNMIVYKLKIEIETAFPGFHLREPVFSFQPTFDIDIAFAHRGKGLARNVLGTGKLIARGKWTEVMERLSVWQGSKKDPYDNFDLQLETIDRAGLSPKYFALVGDYGKYDRNLSYRSKSFRRLLQHLPEVNLHHSYRSFAEPERVKMEKERLEEITGKQVTETRAHFLRFHIPDTYIHLRESGIKDDHSMGYADDFGFRAGIAHAFQYYDLLEEQETGLRIHPFCFMDTAFSDHLQLSPGEALQKVIDMKKILEETGGEMTGIWHNYALGETGPYKGWQYFFTETIKMMRREL